MVLTILGILIIGGPIAIIIVAICKGTALTHPKVEVFSTDGKKIAFGRIEQPWIGPGEKAPVMQDMSNAAHKLAMAQLGLDERGEKLPGYQALPERISRREVEEIIDGK